MSQSRPKSRLPYILTETAENDFRNARNWSRQRWGKDLTKQYFQDLHESALYIAKNWRSLPTREDLTGASGLGVHAAREHYLVYLPSSDTDQLIIVALIRQTRDVPSILRANNFLIKRQLKRLFNKH